jgi:hypothetical protein
VIRGDRLSRARWPGAAAVLLAAAALGAGCTARQVYGTGQAWQQQACNRLPDLQERDRCMASTAMSYDDYRREADRGKAAR